MSNLYFGGICKSWTLATLTAVWLAACSRQVGITFEEAEELADQCTKPEWLLKKR